MLLLLSGLLLANLGWDAALREKIEALDRGNPGALGVYVKNTGDGKEMSYQGERRWYLSSTTKVPVAVLVLRRVEKGEISLQEELVLKESDFVDGAGEIQHREPRDKLSIAYLLDKMLTQSDSTATDMLIRLLGEESLAEFLKVEGEGFGPMSTLLDVRYQAYGELHPKASRLRNRDFFRIREAGGTDERLRAFASRVGVPRNNLRARSLEEAFERFYEKGINSATLTGFGRFLERLVKGELLREEHTDLVLSHMERITTGERRIKAGLPEGAAFAQKTGTQIRRLCNVGVLKPRSPEPVVVAACMERYPDYRKAEGVLKQVGVALAESGLL